MERVGEVNMKKIEVSVSDCGLYESPLGYRCHSDMILSKVWYPPVYRITGDMVPRVPNAPGDASRLTVK